MAINLDGGNYDLALFNASVERPMLLMMSDWVNLPLPGRPSDPAFHMNDYAYEPWLRAGLDPDVVRVRLEGIRHMGYTDLILLKSSSVLRLHSPASVREWAISQRGERSGSSQRQ